MLESEVESEPSESLELDDGSSVVGAEVSSPLESDSIDVPVLADPPVADAGVELGPSDTPEVEAVPLSPSVSPTKLTSCGQPQMQSMHSAPRRADFTTRSLPEPRLRCRRD